MIKVGIVDDQPLIISGLSMMVDLQNDMKVIWTGSSGREALIKMDMEQADLLLMDIRMPEMNGVEATKHIKKDYPDTKILVLTTFNEDSYIFETLKNGASGYLLKDIPPNELIEAIRKAVGGGTIIEANVASKVVENIKTVDLVSKEKILKVLTSRELEISKLIAEGFSNKEIGYELFLSEGTIKNHLTKILEKLELRDRTQLAILILKSDI